MILQQYKIVFAGSMGAGKTEAIRSLSEVPVLATEAFNTDSQAHNKMQTTVGIDYGVKHPSSMEISTAFLVRLVSSITN